MGPEPKKFGNPCFSVYIVLTLVRLGDYRAESQHKSNFPNVVIVSNLSTTVKILMRSVDCRFCIKSKVVDVVMWHDNFTIEI